MAFLAFQKYLYPWMDLSLIEVAQTWVLIKFPQQRVRKSFKTNHITFLCQLPCYVPCNTTTIIPHNTTYWNTTLPLMDFQHRPLFWRSIWTFNTDLYAGWATDFQCRPLCWPSIWTFNTDVYAGWATDFQCRPLCWPSIWTFDTYLYAGWATGLSTQTFMLVEHLTFNTDLYAGWAFGLSTQTFMLAEHLDFQHRPLCWLSTWTLNTDFYAGQATGLSTQTYMLAEHLHDCKPLHPSQRKIKHRCCSCWSQVMTCVY